MALFCRTNSALCPVLNHSYCKFSNSMARFQIQSMSSATNIIQRGAKATYKQTNTDPNSKINTSTGTTFESMLGQRKMQARRSILVQVNSVHSQEPLQQLCSQYGNILSMHHYKTKYTENFILIEFDSHYAVNDIVSSASFMDINSVAPMRTSTLWFHSTKKTNMVLSLKEAVPLSVTNGCCIPSEIEIAQDILKTQSVSKQMVTLHNALKLTDLEIRLRFYTACQVEQCFSGIFPQVSVLPFGSSVNGFGKRGCDLDLVLLLNNQKRKRPNDANTLIFHAKQVQFDKKYEKKEFMSTMADMLQFFVPGIQKVHKVLEARVPIIKCHHQYTNMECDLCVGNRAGVYMSELLCIFGEVDERVRPLIFVIRQWAESHKVTNANPGKWITNFSLTLLVLFYLQSKKILPTINELKLCASHDDIRTDTGVDCTFLRDIKQLRRKFSTVSNAESLESLLHGFFVYYSNFDYETHAICLRNGCTTKKHDNAPLFINNPFDPLLNVSKNVNLPELQHILTAIRQALVLFSFDQKGILPLLGLKGPVGKLKTSDAVVNISKLFDKTMKKRNPNSTENLFSDNSSGNNSVTKKNTIKQG